MASLTFTLKEQGKPSRRVTFKDDNPELLMKPPCTTKVYDLDAPVADLLKAVVAPVDESSGSSSRRGYSSPIEECLAT